MAVNRDHYALIAGIKNYPAWTPRLRGPDADAADVMNWLKDAAGGGVPAANIVVAPKGGRTRDLARARPTRDDIEGPLGAFIERSNAAAGSGENGGRLGQRLYIYVAGHGLAPGPGQSCLLTANASASVPFHVNVSKWVEDIAKEKCFDEIVFWADCCMSGDAIQFATGAPRTALRNDGASPRFLAFAAQYQKQAVEREIEGRVRGVFTYALLRALAGDAVDAGSGRVTAARLEAVLKNSLQTYLPEADRRDPSISQTPYVQSEAPGMLFGPKHSGATTAPVAIAFSKQWRGKRAWIEEGVNFTTVAKIKLAPATWNVRLAVGRRYALRRDEAPPLVIDVAASAPIKVKAS